MVKEAIAEKRLLKFGSLNSEKGEDKVYLNIHWLSSKPYAIESTWELLIELEQRKLQIMTLSNIPWFTLLTNI